MPSELTFRAQLVIPEQRELYDYWCRSAGMCYMPRRAEIEPMHIPHLLPEISLIDVHRTVEESVIRLAGTNIRDIYGCELTGLSLRDLNWGEKKSYWMSAYHRIINQRSPLQGVVIGPTCEQEHLILFWLRLPLSDDGKWVNKILCHDIGYPLHSEESSESFIERKMGSGGSRL